MAKARPSPTALMREMSRVDQLKMWLGEAAEAQLILDTIEGETQALEMLDLIVECVIADKKLSEGAAARALRFKTRADKGRFLAQAVMEKIGASKLERPIYTAAITKGVPSLHITDDTRIPRQYMSPNKTSIKAALVKGEDIPGCTLNNVPTTLRITSK